jgi:hypothetical protein
MCGIDVCCPSLLPFNAVGRYVLANRVHFKGRRERILYGTSHHHYHNLYTPNPNICSPFAALSSSSHLCVSSRLSYLKSGTSRSPQSELPELREATRAAFCLFPSFWRRQLRGSMFLVLPPSSTVRTARPCTSPAYIDTTRRTNPPL